jgi:hypothetical protein
MWLRGDVIPDDAARITPPRSEYAEHRLRDYPLNHPGNDEEQLMNTLGLWATNKAALASGLAIGVSPAVRFSLLDGFAVGALICGACLLLATSSRRPWRSLVSRPERTVMVAGAHRSPAREPRTGRWRAVVRQAGPRAVVRQAGPQAELRQVGLRAAVRRAAPRHAAPAARARRHPGAVT